MPACLACQKGVPKRGRRRCPLCSRSFRSGWEGIETHWRAAHTDVMPYEDFFASLCPAHRGGGDPAIDYLPLGER
jgi:hypothetical protein